jgi:hypothetical protein
MTPGFQQLVDATEWKTIPQGAATQVFVATSPLVEGVSGRDFEDCAEGAPSETPGVGVLAHAIDEEAAKRLWDSPPRKSRPKAHTRSTLFRARRVRSNGLGPASIRPVRPERLRLQSLSSVDFRDVGHCCVARHAAALSAPGDRS